MVPTGSWIKCHVVLMILADIRCVGDATIGVKRVVKTSNQKNASHPVDCLAVTRWQPHIWVRRIAFLLLEQHGTPSSFRVCAGRVVQISDVQFDRGSNFWNNQPSLHAYSTENQSSYAHSEAIILLLITWFGDLIALLMTDESVCYNVGISPDWHLPWNAHKR